MEYKLLSVIGSLIIFILGYIVTQVRATKTKQCEDIHGLEDKIDSWSGEFQSKEFCAKQIASDKALAEVLIKDNNGDHRDIKATLAGMNKRVSYMDRTLIAVATKLECRLDED